MTRPSIRHLQSVPQISGLFLAVENLFAKVEGRIRPSLVDKFGWSLLRSIVLISPTDCLHSLLSVHFSLIKLLHTQSTVVFIKCVGRLAAVKLQKTIFYRSESGPQSASFHSNTNQVASLSKILYE